MEERRPISRVAAGMDWKVRGTSPSWAPAERWKGYNLEAEDGGENVAVEVDILGGVDH